MKILFHIQWLLHCGKTLWNQLNSMHPYSWRAFQWYQEHSKRYCDFKEGLGDLNMTNKTNKLPSPLDILYTSLYQNPLTRQGSNKKHFTWFEWVCWTFNGRSLHTHENYSEHLHWCSVCHSDTKIKCLSLAFFLATPPTKL